MGTFKRTKVVMLPTEKSNLFLINRQKLSFSTVGGKTHKTDVYQPQHLYFLSDDEIKEGDWVYFDDGDHKRVAQVKNADEVNAVTCIDSWKIIATTDESLEHPDSEGYEHSYVIFPKPSQGFIKKFVEKGGIWEVMVEYIETKECDCHYHKFCKSHSLPEELHCERFGPKLYPKVSSDNTITIRPVKDSWNREEVIELCRLAAHNYANVIADEENWIKENL